MAAMLRWLKVGKDGLSFKFRLRHNASRFGLLGNTGSATGPIDRISCILLLSVVLTFAFAQGPLTIFSFCIFIIVVVVERSNNRRSRAPNYFLAQSSQAMFLRHSQHPFLFLLCFFLLSFSPSVYAAPSGISRYRTTVERRQDSNDQPVTFTTVSKQNTYVETFGL